MTEYENETKGLFDVEVLRIFFVKKDFFFSKIVCLKSRKSYKSTHKINLLEKYLIENEFGKMSFKKYQPNGG